MGKIMGHKPKSSLPVSKLPTKLPSAPARATDTVQYKPSKQELDRERRWKAEDALRISPMPDISRRFFLGGAISLVAAVAFQPSVSAMKNLPTIYGNGKDDDTSGLYALLNNEPCTFNKEQIGIESHEGIVFHRGLFIVNKTIDIPAKTKLVVEAPTFIGMELDSQPFFMCERGFKADQFDRWAIFQVKPEHKGKLIDYRKQKEYEYD